MKKLWRLSMNFLSEINDRKERKKLKKKKMKSKQMCVRRDGALRGAASAYFLPSSQYS